MSTAVNEHTGHRIVSRKNSKEYRDRFDDIFGKKDKSEPAVELQGEPSGEDLVTGGELEETAG